MDYATPAELTNPFILIYGDKVLERVLSAQGLILGDKCGMCMSNMRVCIIRIYYGSGPAGIPKNTTQIEANVCRRLGLLRKA